MIQSIITGNLGRDAELKTLRSGDSVCEFSVASSRKVKGEESTTWVKCSIWGKRGETLAQYLKQGSKVAVIGELSVREYERKQGGTGISVECRVSEIDLMGGGGKGGKQTRRQEPEAEADPEPLDAESADGDDIPF